MVEFNLPNAITIGIIAVLILVAVRFAAKAAGKTSPV